LTTVGSQMSKPILFLKIVNLHISRSTASLEVSISRFGHCKFVDIAEVSTCHHMQSSGAHVELFPSLHAHDLKKKNGKSLLSRHHGPPLRASRPVTGSREIKVEQVCTRTVLTKTVLS
jgi:hypothetical protein